MNGTRGNRRKHEYRGGQGSRDLSAAENKELASPDYSIAGRDQGRVLTFKETGIPYTKNYIQNKEALDALRKARFENKVLVWPRDNNGNRLGWADFQVEKHPSGDAKDAAEVEKLSMFYPHMGCTGGLICSAPFCKGEKSFRFESALSDPNKDLLVCKTLAIGEVRFTIMKNLSYHDIGSLQGTCTFVANRIMDTAALWDMSNGRCNYSEFTADEFEILKECGDAENDDEQGNSEFLMISSTHMGYNKESGLQDYATNVALIRGVLVMGRSLQLVGHSIKRVCFNRVDFFDVGVFATYLDLMPNLERADITSCDQIRYHHVPALLDIVQAHNARHGGKLLFDVSPRYNTGALWENGWGDERQGTYGLTFNNPGVRIPPAVCKLYIYDIAPRMKRAGQMHMMESNALFRRFLEKLPLHSKTVPRMEAIAEHKEYLKRLFAKGKINKDHKAKLQIRCTFAELVTMFGKEGWIQLYEDGGRSTSQKGTAASYGVWGDTADCNECHTHLPLMYCTTGYVCDSCRMINAVNNDNYHFKKLKMEGTRYLGCGLPSEPMVPLEQTNMDFSILRDEDDKPRIKRLNDFEILLGTEIPGIRKLFNHARKMDIRGYTGLCVRDLFSQQKHAYDRASGPRDTQRTILRMVYYRKAVTLEEIQKVPKGRVDNLIGQF